MLDVAVSGVIMVNSGYSSEWIMTDVVRLVSVVVKLIISEVKNK